jgi:hypothetical protein
LLDQATARRLSVEQPGVLEMTPSDLRRYFEMAAEHGADHAARQYQADTADDNLEWEIDGQAALDFERAAYGDDNDPICTRDDEYDSRGQRLRPRINDAGESWWM